MKKTQIGNTGIEVPDLCFGTSVLGDMPNTYGYRVDEKRAVETMHAIFDGPVNFIDTSRNYGSGLSEERVGIAIKERGGLPEGFVVSTKLDRDMDTLGFDAGRARKSLEESLTALNLDRVQILHLHDPEHCRDLDEITRKGGSLDELFRIKEEGLADAVGIAMGALHIMMPLLEDWPFDALINHNRYTLLNRSANEMFDRARERSIAIFNAAPFVGGMLAKGSANASMVTYQEPTGRDWSQIREIESACASHGVSTGALALQFSTRDDRIASTIVGISKPERIQQTLEWAFESIPESLWREVENFNYSTEDPEARREYRPD